MSEDTMTTDNTTEPVIDEPAPLTIEDIEAALAAQFPPAAPVESFPGDPDATWVYWSDMDTAERGVPDEWVWERLRIRRDQLLASCDFRVVPDAPWDVQPWIEYRQALRDLPDTTTDPRTAVWPQEP
jgi:hypothetical protein